MDWEGIYKRNSLEEIPWHSEKPPVSLEENLKKIKVGNALEVCSGAGTNSIFLAKKGFKVEGIDISKTVVEIAKKRAKKENLDIDFRTGNVLDLNERKKFEFVFDRGCFHHMPTESREKFVKNIFRSLKENGKFQIMAFSEKNKGIRKGFSKSELRKIFSKYFKIGKIEEEIHLEPDNSMVFLYTALMTKKAQKAA